MQPISWTRRIERPGWRAGATPATCLGWFSLLYAAIWLTFAGALPAWAQERPSASDPPHSRPGSSTSPAPRVSSDPATTRTPSQGSSVTATHVRPHKTRRAFNSLAPSVSSVPAAGTPSPVPSETPTHVRPPRARRAFNDLAPTCDHWPTWGGCGGGCSGSCDGGYGGGFFNPGYPEEYPWSQEGPAEYLQGVAGVMSASGDLAVQLQQAELINQEVVSAKIENRRRIWDQWLYERYNLPTLQDDRERASALATRRALTDPPTTEILTATTLNQLLRSLKGKSKGQPIPIDEGVLRQINVIDPSGGNLGALKPARDGNSLNWPASLKGEAYQDEVKQVNERVVELLKELEFKGGGSPGRVENLGTAIRTLKEKVQKAQSEMGLLQQIEAKRFLNQLDNARYALTKPKAAEILTGKLAPRGKTVPDLLESLYGSGLEFAAATDGDEAAYVALYNALRTYAQSVGLYDSTTRSLHPELRPELHAGSPLMPP
jgi:hypothetical protein